jgi:hypothetical protein
MANSVDDNGVAFNPTNDAVMINGSFLQPDGWTNALWTDPFPNEDYPVLVMVENNFSTLYTNTFLVPAGSPVQVQYKYGIYHNAEMVVNSNCDNEVNGPVNHIRYIRTLGNYSFPVDTFGGQLTTSPPAANEISFGDLAASVSTPKHIALNWLGRPGVYLQMTTNLASTNWTTVTNSGGTDVTNLSSTNRDAFFRLVLPYNP